MEELLISIARGLVEQPDEVRVDTDEPAEDGTIVYHLHVAENDMGRVIGKQGRIAKAIRLVMRAAATKNNCRVSVESTDRREGRICIRPSSFVSCNQICLHKIWDGKRRLSFQAGKQGESAAAIYRSQWM